MSETLAESRPGAGTLDPAALDALHAALREELEAQRLHLADLQAMADDLSGQSDGDSAMAREMAERAILRAADVIVDVEQALALVADGTYGTCERCHGPIGLARLEAIPYARHCMSCPTPSVRLVP